MLAKAKAVLRLIYSKALLIFRPSPEVEPKQHKPDISLVKKFIWESTTLLAIGLRETIVYLKAAV